MNKKDSAPHQSNELGINFLLIDRSRFLYKSAYSLSVSGFDLHKSERIDMNNKATYQIKVRVL